MTTTRRIIGLCALVTLGCSAEVAPPNPGDVTLAFAIAGGVRVDSVTYTVTSASGVVLATGTIDASDPNATLSTVISLPPGAGDVVSLTATDSNGQSCQGMSAPFTITSDTTIVVGLTLTCGGGPPSQPGQVDLDATIVEADGCPTITSAVVAPTQMSVGGSIQVGATASDPDATDTLSYSWTPATHFTSPSTASSTFVCTFSGTQTLTLTVSDNHQPTPCSAQFSATVSCVGVDSNGNLCGDGIVGSLETCDPPNGSTCGPDCQLIRPTNAASTP